MAAEERSGQTAPGGTRPRDARLWRDSASSSKPLDLRSGTSRTALAILVVLLVVRVAAALLLAPAPVADAQGYEAAAERLARTGSFAYPLMDGRYWSSETGSLVVTSEGRAALMDAPRNAYTMPGYPAFRALPVMLVGTGEPSRALARVLQALLSVGSAALIWLLARRFSELGGLVALGLAAVYPPLTLANSYLLTEVLFGTLLLGSTWCLLRWLDTGRISLAAAAGLLSGATLLVRPTMAVWIPAVGVALLVASRDRVRLARQLCVLGAAVVLVMVPWWVRNYGVYDRFVAFSTLGPATSIQAVYEDVAPRPALPVFGSAIQQTAEEGRIQELVEAINRYQPRTAVDELAKQRYFAEEWTRLRSMLLERYAGTMVRARAISVLNAVTWPHATSPTAMGGLPFLLTYAYHVALVALFPVGLFVARRRWDAWVIGSIPLYSLALHAVVLPSQRYLFPMMPMVIVIASIGTAALASRLLTLRVAEPDQPSAATTRSPIA